MESSGTLMVGRDSEVEVLSSFVAAADGQVLVLRGEAGVGKTALAEHAAGLAAGSGHALIRVTGVEAESELPFSGLHQCLYPLLGRAEELDAAQRAAFDTVFGRGTGQPPSIMSLGIAVLDLLALATSEEPLMLLIEDGQWLDESSAEVCGFVARRLTSSSVKMLINLRSDVGSRFDTAHLAELAVEPLAEEDAGRLLDLRHPRLDSGARRVVLDLARGNPLALIELPPYVLGGAGPHHTPEDLPGISRVSLPRRLQHIYETRIQDLPAATREELLRGALDGVAAGGVRGPGHSSRYRMRNVEQAAACGLLDVDGLTGDFVFRHPLIRSAVVQLATPNQRRAAHAELARAHPTDLERRAAHLAASAIDPDDEVAAALDAAAESATRRGGAAAAVAWLTRAAELSGNPADRSRRIRDAAYVAGQAALLDQAQRLLLHTEPAGGAAGSLAKVLASAYADACQAGEVRPAHQRLAAAIEAAGVGDEEGLDDGQTLTRAVNALLVMALYSGDGALWRRTEQILDSLGDRVHHRTAIYRDAWNDVVLYGAGLPERVERAFSDPGLAPWDVTRLGVAALQIDTLNQHRGYLRRAIEREQENGAVADVMTMLRLLMVDQMSSGEWDEAERTGERALELSGAHGYVLYAYHSRAYLGLLAARQGRLERARELQAAVDGWARPRGVGYLTQLSEAVATTAALTEGDYEAAYLYAIGITPPGSFERHSHQAARTLLDLVEAAMHTGRREDARRHALAARDAGLPRVSPRLGLITFGALAVTADDPDDAGAMFGLVEAHPAAADFPYELARIRLGYGTRTRHALGPRAARQPLMRASEGFERLGAPVYAERAQAELRASGMPVRASSVHLAALTWQERQIADLAAGGLTNKEIGERTHLSPRTVSSHLYRIFPKLGVTSRAALRDALGSAPGAEGE